MTVIHVETGQPYSQGFLRQLETDLRELSIDVQAGRGGHGTIEGNENAATRLLSTADLIAHLRTRA